MGLLCKVWLLVLPALSLGISLKNFTLTNISSPAEDRLAEFLLFGTRDSNLWFMTNTRIHIDVGSTSSRRKFENVVERFYASNDGTLIELNTHKARAYDVHWRIYFIDSLRTLELLFKRERIEEDFAVEFHFYFIVIPFDIPYLNRTIGEVFHLCWQNSIVDVNVVIEHTNGVVTLYTYYPFNQYNCNDTKPVIHNRFVNGNLEWSGPTFPSKTSNFWKCPLRVITWHQAPNVILGPNMISGFDGTIVLTLANIMNFSVQIVVSPTGVGNVLRNVSTGAYKLIAEHKGDFATGGFVRTGIQRRTTVGSIIYHISHGLVIFKGPQPYSSLEILLFPFDRWTWLNIFILLIAKWIGEFLWNMIAHNFVSFGEYSMRIRILAWLLTVFILQSSYEGSIFQFLYNRPFIALPNSLDEAIDAGYTFLVRPHSYGHFKAMPKFKDRLIRVDEGATKIFDMFLGLKGKYAIVGAANILSASTYNSSKYGQYFVARVPVQYLMFTVLYPKFSYLTKEMDKRLHELVAHGHIIEIGKKFLPQGFSRKVEKDRFWSIPLQHLLGAFQLWGMCTLMCALVFVMELLSARIQRLRMVMDLLQ